MKIKEIQALRALAAGLVLLFHARIVGGGFIGVDIFYVISGFLITGLILKELEKSERLDFKAFYLRRIKRLLPTSFFVLLITALVSWYIMPVTMRHELGKHIIAAGVYLSNFLFAIWGNDYQNLNATPPVVVHYWSLAVEEQFYLFWPIIIYLAFRKGGRKAVLIAITTITLLSFAFSLFLTQASPVWAFYILPTRAWELGVGALLLFIPNRLFASRIITSAAMALLIYSNFIFNENTPFPGMAALVPVITTAILIGGIAHWPSPITWIGNWRVSQWLGEISYPLYLWHWPVLVLPAIYAGRPLLWWERIACILITILAAHLTHIFIEEPLRHRIIAPGVITRSAAVATLSTVLIGAGIYATYSEYVHVRGSDLVFKISSVMQKPSVYGDGCHSNYRKSIPDTCEYGDTSSSKIIVLYGDSHAAQWFPALVKIAQERNLKLVSFTKSACPAAEVQRSDQGGFKFENCLKWRQLTLERIIEMNPDSIIMSGFQHYALPQGFSSERQWLLDGQRKLAAKLSQLSSRLIYISDTPLPQRDIPSCLAVRRIQQCKAVASQPIVDPRFISINPTSWLCDTTCSSVVKNVVAYRDDSHISVQAALRLKPVLERELLRFGAI